MVAPGLVTEAVRSVAEGLALEAGLAPDRAPVAGPVAAAFLGEGRAWAAADMTAWAAAAVAATAARGGLVATGSWLAERRKASAVRDRKGNQAVRRGAWSAGTTEGAKGDELGAATAGTLPKGDPDEAVCPNTGLGAELAAATGELAPAAEATPSRGPLVPREPWDTEALAAPKGESDLATSVLGVPHLVQATWISTLSAEHRWHLQ